MSEPRRKWRFDGSTSTNATSDGGGTRGRGTGDQAPRERETCQKGIWVPGAAARLLPRVGPIGKGRAVTSWMCVCRGMQFAAYSFCSPSVSVLIGFGVDQLSRKALTCALSKWVSWTWEARDGRASRGVDSLVLWAVFTHCRNTSKVSLYPYNVSSRSPLHRYRIHVVRSFGLSLFHYSV